jgi:hypothetical protein
MEWERNDGVIYSKDNRFEIIKATDRIHSGDWKLYDEHTKQTYFGYSLKHAKQIAEGLL